MNSSLYFAGSDDNNTYRFIIIAPVSVVVAILAIFIVIFLMRKIKQKSKKESQNVDEVTFIKSLLYNFAKIRAATDDFFEANKLGSGGFGAVYKGQLLNGQEKAVKRLAKDSTQGDLEFKNEVKLLARLQHRNLVSLLGFSVEGTEKLLIYEFIQNGSLDLSIFDFGMARLIVTDETHVTTEKKVGTV
ncbi:hypothetical protein RD792_002725 [Penstemon davidsonii]|uniref:Protein kinase domain-containing protein n=1 Tax=Penstemon davidsonii TaxID=160366 RepID=A0ABR0DRT8_9LAMI|nr:hypothetical protein RD792_002725 [Penstemon davidsonii]